jgi:hypothetical protein
VYVPGEGSLQQASTNSHKEGSINHRHTEAIYSFLRKHTEDLASTHINPQQHPMTEKKALSVIIPSIQHQINLQRAVISTRMKLIRNRSLQIEWRKLVDHVCTYQEKKEASSK